MIPLYGTVASAILFLIHLLVKSLFRKSDAESKKHVGNGMEPEEGISRAERVFKLLEKHSLCYGGVVIFWYLFARMIGCLLLLGISVHNLLLSYRQGDHILDIFLHKSLSIVYLYTLVLSSTSIISHKWSKITTRHTIFLLFVSLGVYTYRDVWPLATTTETPMDIAEGKLLWVKITLLAITALLIPLVIPHQYIPVDPNDPMPIPNAELTASLLSFLLYSFLDPVIFSASKVRHLSWSQLPPLTDSNRAKYLKQTAFPHIDTFSGAKKQHLFFGLMRFYRWEYTVMALTIIAQVLFNFAPPIAINRILVYLETNGADTNIRPWFWIVLLFMGPIVTSMSNQWYLFIATQVTVLTEGLLSQLVLEHSLRIRMKAETPKAVVATPDIASVDGQSSSSSSNTTTSGGSLPSSTIKGKEKAKVEPAKKAAEVKKNGGQDNLIGKINNLITTDVSNIVDSKDFLVLFLEIPVQTVLCVVFLYKLLGWSAFIGFSVILIFIPIPGLVTKKIQSVQVKRMRKTDERVQVVTEVVNTLRMVKLFGWEQAMNERIGVKRKEELHWAWIQKVLEMSNGLINFILTSLTMPITYGTYTLIMKQQLNASIIFSSIAVFSLFGYQLHSVSYFTTTVIQGKVSLDRVNDFLRNTELLDTFSAKPQDQLIVPSLTGENDREIGFRDAVFSWSTDSEDVNLSPSLHSFKLRVNGELLFKHGCINLIIGPTGCGKTSMLMALLGEMHFMSSSADAWFNLPRSGGVAYAAQESWVQNATIRENILFGSQLDEPRYKEVIRQCALEKDLELFEAGDQTETRVTLARAIYSPAEIILLDDILAALDVHTSKQIVEDCFKGGLIKGRTIIMVTHNIALMSPIADFVVSIGLDGTVTSQSSDISIALDSDPSLAQELAEEEEKLQKAEEEIALTKKEAKADGKLIIAEEIVEGHVSWKSVKLFLSSLSGGHPIIFFTLWIAAMAFENAAPTFQLWFLGFWGSQYEQHAPSEVRVGFYLGAYSGITGIITMIFGLSSLYYALGSLRASKEIHENLVGSILSSTLRWLDETPTSRIIARCTQDIRAVEGPIARLFFVLVDLGISSLVNLSVIVLYSPVFVFPGLGVAMIGIYIGNVYLKAQMSVKREMSNAKAPVLAHLGASITGLSQLKFSSIRAYSAEDQFKTESLRRIDHYTRIARTSYNLNRWIAIRIDALGAIFTGSLAWYLVYRHSVSSANTGLSLNLAIDFCSVLLVIVRIYNDFEVQSNSLERIKSYIDIEHEPKPTEEGKPPAAWPTSGELRVEKLSARYSQTGPKVLHDISFNIRSGERVGVVGRTGSGKSSLTLALLQCILTEGNVFYDGIPTNNLNLDAVRSNITIIPQMPELLSGTLRRNLDPFEQHDDATLNAALRDAGLFSLQTENGEGRITLDTNIASSGSNLSVGQRQIIALARAIIRKSKVLILDEDYQTDAIIQKTLRNKLGTDVTVLTVAHRLQTIMDADKIMVLDNGRIIEFDSPKVLLTREDSKLKALVDESGDKAALYEIAQSA
ncbi:multidrug resistance-associated ABC transporter [Crucibulum laeve]|uniref:Multidrug resistance-associated ABC transporter n=1 Tax=Crucibulum laeve TaxID=68775 RepID=A0A5C3MF23_9AGAR|nr:multidrug resistance-associated ABC transporter [Crucibulum laeve]